jgi:linoleoyl-CoA desaturase
MANISFSNNNSTFSQALRKRIDDYFKNNNLKFSGNKKLYGKTIVLVTSIVLLYLALVFGDLSLWVSIPLCALMGLNFAAIGFNVMHDGAHGSYSQKKWVNEIMAYSLNLLGGSSYLWKIKHNGNHHSFTNINGMDDDIDLQPWIRFNHNQPFKKFHKYQHIYWVFFYVLAYVSWVFFLDLKKYFSGRIADTTFKKMNLKEHFIFWVSKVVYVSIFLIIPIVFVGFLKALIGYLILSLICGFTLSVVFQLAHVVEGSSFPEPDSVTKKIETDWNIHQLESTSNFATKNRLLSWFVGGLNFQVEHHLFPRISHVHYPKINKIVKDVCSEFNVTYNEYPSMLSALRSHIKYLKLIGSCKFPA